MSTLTTKFYEKIVPVKKPEEAPVKIEDLIYGFTQQLLNTKNLTIENQPATKDDVIYFVTTIETSLEMRKRQAERMSVYADILKKKE